MIEAFSSMLQIDGASTSTFVFDSSVLRRKDMLRVVPDGPESLFVEENN